MNERKIRLSKIWLIFNTRIHWEGRTRMNNKIHSPLYKKWWVWVVAAIIILMIAVPNEDDKNEQHKQTKQAYVEETVKKKEERNEEEPNQEAKPVTEDEFNEYAKNIRGGPFIKSISLIDNKGMIEYYGSYEEFKAAKPNSLLNKEDYTSYFDTGDAIEKLLVSEPVRLLSQFPSLEAISIHLPYDGKTYSIELKRQEVNEYLGFNVEKLSVSDGSWNEKFVDPIVYDERNREKFIDTFVKVR